MLFEQYRLDLNQDKYEIEVQNDDAIKRNQIFFYFMQQTFINLDALYLQEKFLLMDTIIKYPSQKHSAAEIEKLNRLKKIRNKRKEGISRS